MGVAFIRDDCRAMHHACKSNCLSDPFIIQNFHFESYKSIKLSFDSFIIQVRSWIIQHSSSNENNAKYNFYSIASKITAKIKHLWLWKTKIFRLSPSLLHVVSSFPRQQSTEQIELAANVFSCPFARGLTSFSVDFACDVSNTVRLSVLSAIMVGKNLGMIRNLFRPFLARVDWCIVVQTQSGSHVSVDVAYNGRDPFYRFR